MKRHDLISDGYLAEQQRLHAAPRGYGGRGKKWADAVEDLVRTYQARSVLDYGCGQGSLVRALAKRLSGVELREYDPAIPGKSEPPMMPADLVVCTDVLEHIESDKIFSVVKHLAALSERALFAVISLVESNKRLSDGRQAHILIRQRTWWEYMFSEHGFVLAQEVVGRDPKKDHKQFAAVWKPCAK